ncbi:MAG: YceI family protein [Gammaproteobacteria bacterium]|nr:YceI family protein [Gammaproteobacteria bacterium]MDD9807530.1 YceI family protein [Gammaproteobacteria bacterium]MDD9885732.1 YceI family protein [Gammaproteobacteria bacterium]
MMRRFLAAGLILLCAPAGAGWTLDPERSSVTYLSSKMAAESYAAIFEPNRFRRFSGGIGDDGEARVVIDLGSVDTGVEIRDERVKEHVFMVAKHPQATVSLSLPRAARRGMAPGETALHRLTATLAMRGQSHPLDAQVRVTGLGGGALLVETVEPVLLDAKAYGMLDGFETLKGLVGLFNIPTTIPVSLSAVFVKS